MYYVYIIVTLTMITGYHVFSLNLIYVFEL